MKKIYSAVLAAGLLLGASQGFAATGASQGDPVLPHFVFGPSASGQMTPGTSLFYTPVPNLWYAATSIHGFEISLSHGSFAGLLTPTGVNGLQLEFAGQTVALNAGQSHYLSDVPVFTIRNTQPMVDSTGSPIATSLPLQLYFSASQMISSMTWRPLTVSAVPESDVYLLLIAGLAVLGVVKRSRP